MSLIIYDQIFTIYIIFKNLLSIICIYILMICSPEQAKTLAGNMIGKLLITKQTGAAGKICNSVMVTTRMFPRKEYYMAVMLERSYDVSIFLMHLLNAW